MGRVLGGGVVHLLTVGSAVQETVEISTYGLHGDPLDEYVSVAGLLEGRKGAEAA